MAPFQVVLRPTMSRGLQGRIERLERDTRGHGDRLFQIWCGPDEDEREVLREAIARGETTHQDGRCERWQGPQDQMPAPRWTTIEEMTEEELRHSIDSKMARLVREGEITREDLDEIEQERKARTPGRPWTETSKVIARWLGQGK